MMPRRIEIFSAGCPCCDSALAQVIDMLCPSCELVVQDMHESHIAARARDLKIQRVPAVVVDGEVVDCCKAGGIDPESLRRAGVGRPM